MGKPERIAEVLARVAGEAPESKYIRAYHASPHDFNRFDAGKIGTGEGNQAYGHGLYFAQSPSVAAEYRKQFQQFRPNTTGRWSPRTIRDAEDSLAKAGSRETAISHLEALLPSVAEDLSLRPQVEDAIAYLRGGRAPRVRTYEVEIGHPEEALLDYDAPISRQPKIVQKLFGEYAMDRPGDGGRIYRDIATRHGEAFDDDMTGVLANLEASKELLSEGIPGVRYLDQNSRSSGQGTRNYVMFPGTEDQIRILRKYAVPGAIGAGAMQDQPQSRPSPSY
jgi:hypothetical protein